MHAPKVKARSLLYHSILSSFLEKSLGIYHVQLLVDYFSKNDDQFNIAIRSLGHNLKHAIASCRPPDLFEQCRRILKRFSLITIIWKLYPALENGKLPKFLFCISFSERYRDIIEAADTISEMKENAEKVSCTKF